MKFIISGASGVLGFALIKKLLENRNEISILARSEASLSHIFGEFGKGSFYSVHYIDLMDYSKPQIETSGDVFIHLAWAGVEKEARENVELQVKNVGYTLDAIKLAERAGCKSFVGAGSQAEFADSYAPMGNHTPTLPNTAYGVAKLAAGQMGRLLADSVGIRFYWFRIFSLFGPYDRKYSFINIVLERFINNQPLEMTSGNQIWDYLYSYDAASVILDVIHSNTDEVFFSLGSGIALELKTYVYEMKKIVGSTSVVNHSLDKSMQIKRKYLVADTSVISELTRINLSDSYINGVRKLVAHYMKELSKNQLP